MILFRTYHTVQFALYIGISPNSQETSCLLHAPVSHGLASTATFTFARVGDDYHVIDTTPTAESGLNSLQPWIVEHRELDRKRARPAILNVWRFGKPLKYSGLRAASEVPRSASRNSTALSYPYHGQFYG